MESFSYANKYKKGQGNVVVDVDALSRRYALISMLNARLMGFEQVKDQYANDSYFANMIVECAKRACDGDRGWVELEGPTKLKHEFVEPFVDLNADLSLCSDFYVTCSRWAECIFFQVFYGSCLCERLMVDANLVITWSRNPHAKTSIPESQVNQV
jgi:hypothetical protein